MGQNETIRDIGLTRMMTFKEVMKILNIGRATLYRLIESGEIKAYKIGKSVRFKQEEIQRYIDSKQIKPKKK